MSISRSYFLKLGTFGVYGFQFRGPAARISGFSWRMRDLMVGSPNPFKRDLRLKTTLKEILKEILKAPAMGFWKTVSHSKAGAWHALFKSLHLK